MGGREHFRGSIRWERDQKSEMHPTPTIVPRLDEIDHRYTMYLKYFLKFRDILEQKLLLKLGQIFGDIK